MNLETKEPKKEDTGISLDRVLGPEEDFVTDGHQRQQGELNVGGPGGMVVMKVIINRLQGEQLVPVAEVFEFVQDEAVQVHGHVGHVRERDESRAVQVEEDGVERGQPGEVGLEHLGVQLSDNDKVPDQLLVRLRHNGLINAGLEELISKHDSLLEHWKLTEGHVEARSGKYGNLGR